MKIALVSPYDFAYPGGVVNHISCLEHNLTLMGHEVRIIAPASTAVHAFGDRFIPVGKPRPMPVSGSIARITLSPRLSSQVKTILEREKFDIIHLHEPLVPMLCTTFLRLSNIPTVGTFHASGGQSWYSFSWYTYCTPVGKLFLKKWFNKLAGRIAVSPIARNYVNKCFHNEYAIIPNGIDTRHFNPDVAPIEQFNDGKINILFVGRMEKRKGVNYLLDAYKLVKKEVPNSRLIIVGPGIRLRHKYEKQVMRNGLKDVIFTGYTSYDDLPRYYKTASIVCAPAIGWESFGIVLLEAMAVGKPLVASNIKGYASVITHGEDGLLVPPKNSKKLAEILLSLINDKPLQQKLEANGRAKALEYDWEKVTQKLIDYYLKVLNQPSQRERTSKTEAVPVK